MPGSIRAFAQSNAREGQAPARRLRSSPPFTVGRGPVPRHAWVDQSVRAVQRSRGTGPRATVAEQPPLHRRARACPSPCLGRSERSRSPTIAGDRPPRDGMQGRLLYRRARACPSPCLGRSERSRSPTIAGDRPPRDGMPGRLLYRRARACPSPCLGLS